MPVPYKHQLRRGQAVDELDWPPQASSSGSSDSVGSGDAAPTQKDGVFKVMLVGESGVGKSTLAATFGGLQGDGAHEMENSGIWEGAPCRDESVSGVNRHWRTEAKRNFPNVFCGSIPRGGFPAAGSQGVPGYQVSQVLGNLLTGFVLSFSTEDTYERRIIVDREEVTLIVYDIWEQVRMEMWP